MKKLAEIPLKQWLAEQAAHLGVTANTVWKRVFVLKTVRAPKLRRVNARVVFVIQES